jgi:hypothetical protein
MKARDFENIINGAAKKLADQGKLIEAGWAILRSTIDPAAPQVQIDEMRLAYMAGAQHLFTSMVNILDQDEEPTEADLKKMDLIAAELRAWEGELAARYMPTKGRG